MSFFLGWFCSFLVFWSIWCFGVYVGHMHGDHAISWLF
jgi:hypothetical protein